MIHLHDQRRQRRRHGINSGTRYLIWPHWLMDEISKMHSNAYFPKTKWKKNPHFRRILDVNLPINDRLFVLKAIRLMTNQMDF